MSESSRTPLENLFADALRDALTVVLERAAEQVSPPDPGPLGLGIKEAAAFLGVTETCMRELVRREDFPAVMVSGKYLISRAGLSAWLERECGNVS